MERYKEEVFAEGVTCTSTIGVCSCGGFINFEKELPKLKLIMKIGKYYLQKVERIIYQCSKCGVYR